MITKCLILAVRNVTRLKMNFRLAILSVAIGLASVMIISSAGESGSLMIMSALNNTGIKGTMYYHPYSSIDSVCFTDSVCEYIKESRNLGSDVELMPFSMKYVTVSVNSNDEDIMLWGINSSAGKFIKADMKYGRMPDKRDTESYNRVAVISEGLAKKHFNRSNILGQFITIENNGSSAKYEVVGVISSDNGLYSFLGADIPEFIYAPNTAIERYNNIYAERLIVNDSGESKDRDEADELQKSVKSGIQSCFGSEIAVEVTDFDEGVSTVKSVSDILKLILTFAASVAIVVAGIGIMNSMLSSVNERRQEIGIMKAIGATDSQVAFCFVFESVIICILGIAIGILTGLTVLLLFFKVSAFDFIFDFQTAASAVMITGASGLLFGVAPALRASKLKPIDALNDSMKW